MRIRRFLTLCSALTVCAPVLAGAQDTSKVGITMGYPGSVGLLWYVTDSVAIRPAITFSHSSNDGVPGSQGSSFGLDLGALLYVKKYDNVRTYISPRFSYTHTSTTLTSSGIPPLEATSNSTGGAGTFGAQFLASPRFSVYGEAGLSFAHRTSETKSVFPSSSKGTTWGTVAGVGIVFYL